MFEIPIVLMNAEGDGSIESGVTEGLEAMYIEQYITDGNDANLSGRETLVNLRYCEEGNNDNFPYDSLNSG